MEKTRAVAYIRVSTERDAQLHSYEFQEHYWQSAFEDDPNTDLIGIYADKGISGHSVQKRPKFLVMMQEAREHKFDKSIRNLYPASHGIQHSCWKLSENSATSVSRWYLRMKTSTHSSRQAKSS